MHTFPVGIVTFVLTDIEDSTRLWETEPDAMAMALARHDELITEVVAAHGGLVIKSRGEGDAVFSVFSLASSAAEAVCKIQALLHTQQWPTSVPLRVRIAMHIGEADLRDGDYYGPAVNRCARLRSAAHGGQALVSGPTAELVRDVLAEQGAELLSLGLHRLKDLIAPKHVYQLVQPGIPSQFPALRSLDAFPNNLPMHATRFIGREKELAEVTHLSGETRLLTLTGAAGTGKTRMALQTAADLLDTFPDGAWIVEMGALVDPLLLPQTIAAVVGVREQQGRPVEATLIEYLCNRELLLVLDNAEHVVEACATLVSAILRACPQVRMLVTSREPLNVPGETLWTVPPLGLPDTNSLPSPQSLSMYEAVRLFLDRATAAQPRFLVTNENVAVIAEICHQLDGIPLAIELAAAKVKVLAVEQIAKRLNDRFRLLTGGSRTVLPRQQTLRAAMDWSYDLLNPQEQTLWCRLSIFAGSFTLEAAEAVCEGGEIAVYEVLDLLSNLVAKSLVVPLADVGEHRYRLLETVRQYGRNKLAQAKEEHVWRSKHRDFYIQLAEQAHPNLEGMEARLWFDRLDVERDNIRAALEWCKLEPAPDAGLRLGAAMYRFWYQRGQIREGLGHLKTLLALPGGDPDSLVRARALHGAGNLARYQQDPKAAEQYYAQALALFRRHDHRERIAVCLNSLGNIALVRQDLDLAERLYAEAVVRGEAADALSALLIAMSNLIRIYLLQDRLGEAEPLIERLQVRAERAGFAIAIRRAGILRSMLLARRRDLTGARRVAEDMLQFARGHGSTLNVMRTLVWLGMLHEEIGDIVKIKALLEEVLSLAQGIELGGGVLRRLLTLAAVLATAHGPPAQAARLLGAADRATSFDDLIGLGDPRVVSDRLSAQVREKLGEQVFEEEWSAGEGLTQGEMIALAVAAISDG